MTATVEIQLDLSRAAAVKRLFAKQSDIGARYIVATITDHQQPVEFGNRDSVYFRWEREGEEKSRTLCEILTGGRVCMLLPAQALSEPSVLHCDFAVETEEVDSVTVSTEPFLLEVQQSAVNGSESDSVTGAVLVDQVVEDYSLGAVIRPPEGADGMRTAKVLSVQGLVDPSKDTVTPSTLVKDYTAHDAEGNPIVGELDVDAVRDEGYAEGQTAGYSTGYADGKTDGIESGKQELHEISMKRIQYEGKRTDYTNVFVRWNDEMFKPLYPFNIVTGNRMFQNAEIQNIKTTLEQRGLAFDTSRATTLTQMFQSCTTEELPFIDGSLATNTSYTFACNFLISLHIRVSEVTEYSSTFIYARSLKSLNLEGTIGKNGFNVSWSPLDKPSLTSIVNALSTTTTGLTVTLRLDAVNKAFETSEGAMDGSTSDEWLALAATKANWTISLINS